MNSPSAASSPTYRNLKYRHKQSPVELKEKIRKNYKDKIQSCRNMLLNKLRGTIEEEDIINTLTDIYRSMFNFSNNHTADIEENDIMEEIKVELVQEELQWWIKEYEKSNQENIDWSSLEQDHVICPVCVKVNITLENNVLSCPNCKIDVPTNLTILEIRRAINNSIIRHSITCSCEIDLIAVSEGNETHIYLICDACTEMQLVI